MIDRAYLVLEDGSVFAGRGFGAEAEAHGEYIGVARFSIAGAAALREHYHRCREQHAGKPFRGAKVFEKAYLIHLVQEMVEAGVRMAHVGTPGGYMEIDTQQDFDLARQSWGHT